METEIRSKLRFIAETVAKKYDLDFIVLFGSRANHTARPDSDFDIGYGRKERLDFDQEYLVGKDFISVFKTDLFDVVHLRNLSPVFMYHIMKDATLLYGNRIKFYNLYSYAIKSMYENISLYQLKFDRLCAKFGVV